MTKKTIILSSILLVLVLVFAISLYVSYFKKPATTVVNKPVVQNHTTTNVNVIKKVINISNHASDISSSTDTSDTALTQDLKNVDTQINNLNTEYAEASSTI